MGQVSPLVVESKSLVLKKKKKWRHIILRSELFQFVRYVLQLIDTSVLLNKYSRQLKGIKKMTYTFQNTTKNKRHETHEVLLLLLCR